MSGVRDVGWARRSRIVSRRVPAGVTGLRVEAVLAVLAAMGSAPAPAASPGLYAAGTLARDATHRAHPGALAWLPFAVAAAGIAWYTCLALEPGARSARAEPLTALTLQWLTVAVTQRIATTPAVIIAGADEITRTHLEALADACERRGVPLNLLFRHLLGCCCGPACTALSRCTTSPGRRSTSCSST